MRNASTPGPRSGPQACRRRRWRNCLLRRRATETDRAGRIMVEPDCTLPGHPEVFAIGDMVSLNGLPGIAQPALQEGKYVGKVIRARLGGDATSAPFKYFDKGSMATIGRTHAVAHSGKLNFTGLIAYLMWAFIHVLYLIGWGNRFGTLYSWGRSLWFTKNRAHRTITLDQAIEEIGSRSRTLAPSPQAPVGVRSTGTVRAALAISARKREPIGRWIAADRSRAIAVEGSSSHPLSSRDSPPHATASAGETRARSLCGSPTCTSMAASTLPSANTGIAMQWFPTSSSPDDTAKMRLANAVEAVTKLLGRHDGVPGELGQALCQQAVGDAGGRKGEQDLTDRRRVGGQRRCDVETGHRIVWSLFDVPDFAARQHTQSRRSVNRPGRDHRGRMKRVRSAWVWSIRRNRSRRSGDPTW